MKLIGSSGNTYDLGELLGRGGEGSVYRVVGKNNIVAKVYNDKVNKTEKQKKIKVMAKYSNDPGLTYTTWPLDVLYDVNTNEFVGFTMTIVPKNKQINEIYDTSSDEFYNWSKRILIAFNLCVDVESIHDIDQCCGDFNPNNICVDVSNGNVYIIDTDSFHIKDGDITYRCSVGMPDYLPKEVQLKMKNQSLADAEMPTFTKDSDNFALAVHIFQLLMNGCHPFNMRVTRTTESVVRPPMDENIINGYSIFFTDNDKFAIPIFAPPINILPSYIIELFRRAFIDGNTKTNIRPSATEWMAALKKLAEERTVCSKNKDHIYYDKLDSCPWCKIDENLLNAVVPTTTHISAPGVRRPTVYRVGSLMIQNGLTYKIGVNEVTVVSCSSSYGSVAIPQYIYAGAAKYPVTGIENNAFIDCKYITGVSMSDSIQFIGDRAFYHCYKLKNINLSKNLTRIGKSAFHWCKSLQNIFIPASVTSIGDSAFAFSSCHANVDPANPNYCSKDYVLYSKDMKTVLYVPMSFTNYHIPDTVTTIGGNALSSNPNISISIGNNQYFRIVDDSLYDKSSKIIIHASNRSDFTLLPSTERIGEHAFHACNNMVKIKLPDCLKEIGPHAFWGCENLPNISLPTGLETIEYGAFYRCISLRVIKLPETLKVIEENAFWGCKNLGDIIIPKNVTHIGKNAFMDCWNLNEAHVSKNTIVDPNAFSNRVRITYY